MFGAENQEGQKWAEELMETFRKERHEAGWEALLLWRSWFRGKKRKVADFLASFLGWPCSICLHPSRRRGRIRAVSVRSVLVGRRCAVVP